MASFYWIKLYYEILDDPKMGFLPDNIWRRCIELFLMAGEIDLGGQLPPTEKIAWRLRQNPAQLQTEIDKLVEVGILAKNSAGWMVVKFYERQKPVSSTERSQRKRQRDRRPPLAQLYGVQAPENAIATATQPECNASATYRCTDTDTDTDIESTAAKLTNFYLSYVNQRGRSDQNAADIINNILDTYHHPDIDYAITESIKAGANNLNYIEAICKRRESGQPDQPKERKNGQSGTYSRKRKANAEAPGIGPELPPIATISIG